MLFLLLSICCIADDLQEIIAAIAHPFDYGADNSEYHLSLATAERVNKNKSSNSSNNNVNVNKQRFLLKKPSLFSLQNVKLLTGGGGHIILSTKEMLPGDRFVALPSKKLLRNITSLDIGSKRKEFDADTVSLPGLFLRNLDSIKMKNELDDDAKSMLSFAAQNTDFIPADQKQVFIIFNEVKTTAS